MSMRYLISTIALLMPLSAMAAEVGFITPVPGQIMRHPPVVSATEATPPRGTDVHVVPAPTTAVKNSVPPQASERIQSKVEEKAGWANSLPSVLPPLPPLPGDTRTDMSKSKPTNITNVGATEDSATDVTDSLVAITKAKDYVEEPVGSSTSQAPSPSSVANRASQHAIEFPMTLIPYLQPMH